MSVVVMLGTGLMIVRAVTGSGLFELEGNAESEPAAGADWDHICHEEDPTACPNDPDLLNTSGATAASWVAELNTNATIFTGGGSKDPEDIDQWAWKDGAGGLPDKDNLTHSFAARYSQNPTASCPNGTGVDKNGDGDILDPGEPFDPTKKCEILFFGSDRFDNSGDAHQAFWFFQNKIELSNVKSGGGFKFSGVHRDGDLLVISNFSNGGDVSKIFVYVWDASFAGNLRPISDPEGVTAKCGVADANSAFCGIVNAANGTVAPWPYTDKSGNSTYLQGEFYEGGINLSSLGLGDKCFATVASETRSSTSLTATLKDFVLGPFGNCETQLVTTPSAGTGGDVFPGTKIWDSAQLTISGTSTWSGTLRFYLCGPDDLTTDGKPNSVSGTCATGGDEITPAIPVDQSTTQPILSTVTTAPNTIGRYCWRGVFESATDGVPNATDASAGECFNVIVIQPLISTGQTYTVKDSATITASGGGNLAGSVRFRLYNNATCTPGAAGGTFGFLNVLHDQTVNIADASPKTVETSVVTLTNPATAATSLTLAWLVEYTSTNPNQLGVTSACNVERATLNVSNVQ